MTNSMMKTITSTAHDHDHNPASANGLAGHLTLIATRSNSAKESNGDTEEMLDQIHQRAHMRTTLLEELLRQVQPASHWGINE